MFPGINLPDLLGRKNLFKAGGAALAGLPFLPGMAGASVIAGEIARNRSRASEKASHSDMVSRNSQRDDAMARRAAELRQRTEMALGSQYSLDGPAIPNVPTLDPALAAQYAASEFDPQIAALLAASQDAERRASRNKRDVGSMYDQLAESILADAAGIDKNYDTAGANVGEAYDETSQEIQGAYDETAARNAAIRKRLGLDEAAGIEIEGQSQADRNYFSGRQQENKAGAQTLLDSLQANAVTANTGYSQSAKAAGVNAQADITRQLTDLLAQNNMHRMTLEGQKAARQNELAMGIEQTNYGRGMDSWNMQRQANQDALSLFQMQQEAMSASQPSFNDQWKTMTPVEKLEFKATELTNGDQKTAAEYMDFIRNIADNDPDILTTKMSAQEFSRRVRAANRDGKLSSAKLHDLAVYAKSLGII